MNDTAPVDISKTRKAVGGSSPLDGFITFRVSRLRKLLDRYSSTNLLERHQLTLAEWRVLATAHAASPTTVKWLANELLADKAEVSRSCASLVERKLLKRLSDEGNLVVFTISRAGTTLYEKIMPERLAVQQELASLLTKSELLAFNSATEKLAKYLAAKVADGSLPKRTKRRRP